jgi:hypothetical protein
MSWERGTYATGFKPALYRKFISFVITEEGGGGPVLGFGFMASLKSTTIMAMQSIVKIQARARTRKLKDIFGK